MTPLALEFSRLEDVIPIACAVLGTVQRLESNCLKTKALQLKHAKIRIKP